MQTYLLLMSTSLAKRLFLSCRRPNWEKKSIFVSVVLCAGGTPNGGDARERCGGVGVVAAFDRHSSTAHIFEFRRVRARTERAREYVESSYERSHVSDCRFRLKWGR
jgi:hypothetical protein